MVVNLRAQLLRYFKINVSVKTRSSIEVLRSGHDFRLEWLATYYQGSQAALAQYNTGQRACYDIATTQLDTITGLSEMEVGNTNTEPALVGALYHGNNHYVILLAYPGETYYRLYDDRYGFENKGWIKPHEMRRYLLRDRPPNSFENGNVTYRIITMWFYGAQSHL
jgi:hypothetical protein